MRGPKPADLLKEMKALDHAHGPRAYRILVDMMLQDDDLGVKVKAAQIILEHARGKPKQSVELSGGLAFDLVGIIDQAHDAALKKAIARR